jgi:hypothetical protein
MAIETIPQAFKYICDLCGKKHLQENASGHYSNSRPPRWATLIVAQDAYDYQGCAVGDRTIKRLLCDGCRALVIEAINNVKPSEREG